MHDFEEAPLLSCALHAEARVNSYYEGHGRVAVKIEVLAPNQRPIQVTDDLSNFWREQYPKIKPELSRRYPRHPPTPSLWRTGEWR